MVEDVIHIDWSEATVSDGTSKGTSKSEARVEVEALRPLLGDSRRGSHCEDGVDEQEEEEEGDEGARSKRTNRLGVTWDGR